ncbi:MAG: hypothetical protein DWQ05_21340 [Calditrichaeota bacterium]|nr:MAG: hypothetical protein DWQ05_21340 [Calditrichota bacterium]
MRSTLTFVLMAIAISSSYSHDKSKFDVNLPNTMHKFKNQQIQSFQPMLKNSTGEASMLPGGYFTLGTAAGLSGGFLDDKCDITFGHPYALTSYPLLFFDGAWYRLDQFFEDSYQTVPLVEENTLSLTLQKPGVLKFKFSITQDTSDASFHFLWHIENRDSVAHNLGVGFVFDAALGKYSDGYATISNLDGFEVWERPDEPRGLGASYQFAEPLPDLITSVNWPEVNDDILIAINKTAITVLYDLAVVALWSGREINPGEEFTTQGHFQHEQPEFSPIFMRTDLPTALSIEHALLFPKELPVNLLIGNSGEYDIDFLSIVARLPEEIYGDTLVMPGNIPAQTTGFTTLNLQTRDRFEDIVVEVNFRCSGSGAVVDELSRKVFIPAVAASDVGHKVIVSDDQMTL